MTDFVSPFTKLVTGPGHLVEDANPTPIVFRATTVPTPQPAGRSVQATGSPFPGNNPMPK